MRVCARTDLSETADDGEVLVEEESEVVAGRCRRTMAEGASPDALMCVVCLVREQ